MQKKTLAGLLALSLPLTIFATDALAANRDVHEIDTQKTYVYKQFINNESQFMDLIDKLEDNPSNYLFEMNGYGYNYAALYEKYRATNNLESALEQTPKEQLPGEVEGELKVESVSAINANELQVTFSKDVTASAEEKANYEISVNGDKIAGNNAIQDIKVNGKTALLRLKDIDSNTSGDQNALRAGDKIVVQTNDAITAKDGKAFPKFASPEFVYNITTEPALKKIDLSASTDTLTFTFDRPVATATTLVKVDGIDIGNKNLDAVDATKAGSYSYTISLSGTVTDAQLKSFKANGTHEVVLFDVKDTAAANPVVASVITGSYVVAQDTAAPTIVAVKTINANKFFVETNRPVTTESNSVKVEKGVHEFVKGNVSTDYSKLDFATGTLDNKPGIFVVITDANPEGTDENPLYKGTETAVSLKVTIENYKANDLVGAKYVGNVTLNKDATKPEVKRTALDASNNELSVTFKSDLVAAPAASDIIVRDKDGVVITPQSIALNSNKSSIVEVTFAPQILENDKAPYTVEFKAGKIQYKENKESVAAYVAKSLKNDKLVATVRSSETGFKYKAFSDLLASITDENNVITIDYKAEMTDTARQAVNYKLDGKALPAGTSVDFVGDKTKVVITLPEGSVKTTTGYKLTISTDVTTKAGEHIVKDLQTKGAYEDVVQLVDNTKPELKEAVYVVSSKDATATDKIKLTFNEDLDTILDLDNAAKNFEIVINGSKQTGFTVAEGTAGDAELVITLASPVAVAQSTTITIVADSNDDVHITDTSANPAKIGSKVVANTKELDLDAALQEKQDKAAAQAKVDAAKAEYDNGSVTLTGGVTWTKDGSPVTSGDQVTRPAYGQNSKTVTYVASATVGKQTVTKNFDVSVPALEISSISLENSNSTIQANDNKTLADIVELIGEVTANMDDNSTTEVVAITVNNLEITEGKLDETGTVKITVTVDGKTATHTVTVE